MEERIAALEGGTAGCGSLRPRGAAPRLSHHHGTRRGIHFRAPALRRLGQSVRQAFKKYDWHVRWPIAPMPTASSAWSQIRRARSSAKSIANPGG